MRADRRYGWLIPLAALPILLAGCGSAGGGPEPTSTSDATVGPTQPPTTPTVLPPTVTAGTPPGGSQEDARDALLRMVLPAEELPAGLLRVDETFTTNEQLIAASPDRQAKQAELERSGRILGYEVTFAPDQDAPPDIVVQGITMSASLFQTAEGAALSFAEGRKSIDETDWRAGRSDLEEFRQELIEREGLADELVWLRLSGLSPLLGAIIVEDLIIFRVGRQRGFLHVVAAAPGANRDLVRDEVEAWLQAMVGRVKEAL